MRPLDNDPAPGTVRLSPSASPARSVGPAQGAHTVLGVETRSNGRWRYGRKIRDEQAGTLADSTGRHTELPRVARRPNVVGVSAMQPVAPPTKTTTRTGTATPDGLGGSC